MASWYVIRKGKEYGPYDARQIRSFAAKGKLKPKYRLRRSDRADTVPATEWETLLAAEVESTTGIARVKAAVDRVSPLTVVAAMLGLVAVGIAVTRLVEDEPPAPVAARPAVRPPAAQPDAAAADALFAHDFSRDDMAVPVGASASTRELPTGDDAEPELRGLPARFAGYELPSGAFVRHGPWTIWRNQEQTEVAREGSMWRGRLHGQVSVYAGDGRRVREEAWVHGARHGVWRAWDEAGGCRSIDRYFAGEQEGLAERWHANGQFQAVTPWRGGKQHGVAKTWFEDGGLESEITYADGVLDGRYVVYRRAGDGEPAMLWREGECRAGAPQGTWRIGRPAAAELTVQVTPTGAVVDAKGISLDEPTLAEILEH